MNRQWLIKSRAWKPNWQNKFADCLRVCKVFYVNADSIKFHPIDKKTSLLLAKDVRDTYFEVFAPRTTNPNEGEEKLKMEDFIRRNVEGTL